MKSRYSLLLVLFFFAGDTVVWGFQIFYCGQKEYREA